MINAFNFLDPVDAHNKMCETLMFGDRLGKDFDWTHGTEVGLHNVAIFCKTMQFEYNLKKLWVPPSRWKMMVRQYIDADALDDCLDKIEERMSGPKYGGKKGRGIAVLRAGEHEPDTFDEDNIIGELDYDHDDISYLKTRMVQGKGTGRGVRRRWGSCMLNLSFRSNPIPTISLHSRTTYFGYLALVDMAVARAFANEVSKITDIPLEKMQFVWTLDLAQFHGFRSLAWALSNKDIKAEMDENVKDRLSFSSYRANGNQVGFRKALDGYHRILKSDEAGTLYGDESFSSFARIRRRFHTEVYGPDYAAKFIGGTRNRGGKAAFPVLPDTMVSGLDFTALKSRPDVVEVDDDEDDED
jgi:hypothetical protein